MADGAWIGIQAARQRPTLLVRIPIDGVRQQGRVHPGDVEQDRAARRSTVAGDAAALGARALEELDQSGRRSSDLVRQGGIASRLTNTGFGL